MLTGLAPSTKLSDLRICTKGVCKIKMKKEYERLGIDRVNDLASDLSNLSVARD